MTEPQVKVSAMAAFARQLRSWRDQFDWSQLELATRLRYSNSLISQIENRQKPPSASFAARCDEILKAPGTFKVLQELVAREAYPAFYAPAIEFEQRAVRIHQWSPIVVPGLLQTECYARSVISAGEQFLGLDEVEAKAARRRP